MTSSDFQEALSLLVYRNLWYMDAQVCFLKVLFKTWIDHFFQISSEISSDGRLKTLISFRVNNLFDASRVASNCRLINSVCRVIDQIPGSYLLSCMAFSVLIRSRSRDLSVAKLVYLHFSWSVNKVSTRQTSYANDFLNKAIKVMQGRNLCAQGIGV